MFYVQAQHNGWSNKAPDNVPKTVECAVRVDHPPNNAPATTGTEPAQGLGCRVRWTTVGFWSELG
jgi:hypothetical protein